MAEEKRYEILETILLNFITPQDQYSTLFHPEDDAQVITRDSEVYLLYEGKKHNTIDGLDLIQIYLQRGYIKEI